MCRAKATTDDDCVGVGEHASQYGHQPRQIVTNLHLQQRVDSVGSKLLSDERGVRVDDLPEK